MQLRQLGESGLAVSPIALGTLTWGRDTDDFEAHDLLERFFAAGGNLIDTAGAYGDGAAEALLGEVLKTHGRARAVVATKVGRAETGQSQLGRKQLRDEVHAALGRLDIDYIDLLQLQAADFRTPIAEIADTVGYLVAAGKVNYIGVSNFPAWQVSQLHSELDKPERLVAGQYEYSLLARSIEADVLPALHSMGLSAIGWSPLGRGVLSGKYRHSIPADSRAASPHLGAFAKALMGDTGRPIVEAVAAAATGLGVTPAEVAMAWVRDRAGVASVISGARSAGQLETVLASADLVLPRPVAVALDEVSAVPAPYPSAGWHLS